MFVVGLFDNLILIKIQYSDSMGSGMVPTGSEAPGKEKIMLQISEFALSAPAHGVVYRASSRDAAEAIAARYTPELINHIITEEKRPAAAHGLCVAVGGLHRTWELVVGEPDPANGLYPVTERAALALGIGGHAGALRAPGIVTLSDELKEQPEIEHEATINTSHNRPWSVAQMATQAIAVAALNALDRPNWEAQEYGPALRKLLAERHARHAYIAY